MEVNLRILESAWKGISCGRYYGETFNIISDLIFNSEERNVFVEDKRFQESIDSIFQETVNFFGHDVEYRSSQVQLCAKELEDFMGGISNQMDNIVYRSSFYDRIVLLGDSALLVARAIIGSEDDSAFAPSILRGPPSTNRHDLCTVPDIPCTSFDNPIALQHIGLDR